jgi:hypothetical protein
LSKADPNTGRLSEPLKGVDGIRCYAATMEARHTTVRNARWQNWRALRGARTPREMTRLILDSLAERVGTLRVHDSGDFYSQDYFDAWVEVARSRSRTLFYAYTKSLPYWVRRLREVGDGRRPGRVRNLVLTASRGGRHDALIARHNLRSARVVFSEAEAEALELEIDHDDGHARQHGGDFALLIHGSQAAGSEASKALSELRKQGWTGYGPKRVPLEVL